VLGKRWKGIASDRDAILGDGKMSDKKTKGEEHDAVHEEAALAPRAPEAGRR
jgi:hypothetical protein